MSNVKTYDDCITNYSKLYYNLGKFNNFKNIDENNLYEINELVNHFKGYERSIGYEGYKMAINYLTNPYNKLGYDFDTKIAFLILCCDPFLIHFNTYMKKPIISEDEISEIETIEEKNDARKAKIKQLKDFANEVKYRIDFYDYNLVNLEFAFFKKFYSDKVLFTDVKADMINLIYKVSLNYPFLNTLTNNEIEKLINNSKNYLSYLAKENKNNSINTMIFNIFYQGEILGLETIIQKLFFLVATIDGECRALSCSNSLNVHNKKQEIENLIGFYNENFIKAEKEYQKIIHRK